MKTTTKTSELWTETHAALCGKRWSEARRLLDELSLRRDNRDLLSDATAYGCPAGLLGVIGDRIELCNAKAAC